VAINILGTVEGEYADGSTEMRLQPMTSFQNSIEPVSVIFFFENSRWLELREFTEAGSTVQLGLRGQPPQKEL